MIPPKLSKPPLRRIVGYVGDYKVIPGRYALDCGHEIKVSPRKGLMESWRRVRCKECVR